MVPLHLQGDLVLTLFLRPVSHQERIIFEVKKRELEWETLVFELAKSEDDETHDINDWLSINISALPRYGSWDFVATPLWSAGGRKQFSVPSPDTVVDFRLSRNVIWSVGCTPDLGAGNTSAGKTEELAFHLPYSHESNSIPVITKIIHMMSIMIIITETDNDNVDNDSDIDNNNDKKYSNIDSDNNNNNNSSYINNDNTSDDNDINYDEDDGVIIIK